MLSPFRLLPARFPSVAAALGLLVLTLPPATAAPAAGDAANRYLVEAESFQFPGNWYLEGGSGTSGDRFLRTANSQSDAMTVVTLPAAGRYHCWVRARDFATQEPKRRRFLLTVDGAPADTEAGQHGQEGWRFEEVATRDLTAGDHVLGLRDTTHFFPRCDAIYLTTGSENPNDSDLKSLAKFHLDPKRVVPHSENQPVAPPVLRPVAGARPAAQIGNDAVRVNFYPAQDAAGRPAIVRTTELRQKDAWVPLPVAPNEEALVLVYSPKSDINTNSFFPFWPHGEKVAFEAAGKTYETFGGRDPFVAGDPEVLVPRSCHPKDAHTVEVEYEGKDGRKVTTVWQVKPGRRDVQLEATIQADKAGDYSLGFCAFQGWTRGELEFGLIPPVYNFQRLPDGSQLSLGSTTPQPLVLVQAPLKSVSGGKYTFAALADPPRIPFDWATPTNGPYGFALLNHAGKVQPTVFSPVLGLPDSRLEAGQSKTVSWSLLAMEGDWKDALEYASNVVFGVTDYRRPYGGSLTDAALNMIDLIKDDEHSGWDAHLKGFYNIESKDTASEASPLPLMEAAVLTRDEDLYKRRALPALEYTLSRPAAHFATHVPPGPVTYVNEAQTRMHVPSSFYGASYWQGVDDLLGRRNAWLGDYAYENGKVRTASTYSSVPPFSDLLGAYRLNPQPSLLEEIKQQADAYLQAHVYGPVTKDIGVEPFVNVSYYPYWWDLVDLYELTQDKKYLAAAEEGAFHTISDLWAEPAAGAGDVTQYPGDVFPEKSPYIWWKGGVKYRLGWPLQPGELHTKPIPQWLGSRVGLGIEQPSTYYGGGAGQFHNIMMSCWAPNLLRVYEYTGREILNTYARDTIIGRFNNYPGYYIAQYSDIQLAPRYPFEGPDVTSIYYHHIPPHLGFTLDFIFTEAEVRSKGKIKFPWVKQQGYVWFTNRIFGHAPGQVYGDAGMWPVFERGTVKVGSDQITYLPAQSDKRFDLVLMNESPEAVSTPVRLDAAKLGLDLGQPRRLIVNGEEREAARVGNAGETVEIPARGTVVVSYATHGPGPVPAAPALDEKPAEQTLTGEWGTLHAFRIRSPFAKDSLYVVLTGRPAKGGSVRLVLDGEENAAPEAKEYPYEFSVYPLPMNRDLTFHVVCATADGAPVQSRPITLKGTPSH